MIPVYKIKGVLETFYVFGKEKLLEYFMDDGVPAQLWDSKVEDLDRLMVIITKTLEIEQMNYKIGQEVEDNAGHVLRVVTINSKGVYITVDDSSGAVKYYQERELSNVIKSSGLSFSGLAESLEKVSNSFNEAVKSELGADLKTEKSEHQRQIDFFFKRGNK